MSELLWESSRDVKTDHSSELTRSVNSSIEIILSEKEHRVMQPLVVAEQIAFYGALTIFLHYTAREFHEDGYAGLSAFVMCDDDSYPFISTICTMLAYPFTILAAYVMDTQVMPRGSTLRSILFLSIAYTLLILSVLSRLMKGAVPHHAPELTFCAATILIDIGNRSVHANSGYAIVDEEAQLDADVKVDFTTSHLPTKRDGFAESLPSVDDAEDIDTQARNNGHSRYRVASFVFLLGWCVIWCGLLRW